MDLAYLDTSVLLKTYFVEKGSRRARTLVRQRTVVTSSLALVEIASAVTRRRLSADLSARRALRILERADQDARHWHLVLVAEPILERAREVVQEAGLRTLDAVHVASALVLRDQARLAPLFVTADLAQADAAARLGLPREIVG